MSNTFYNKINVLKIDFFFFNWFIFSKLYSIILFWSYLFKFLVMSFSLLNKIVLNDSWELKFINYNEMEAIIFMSLLVTKLSYLIAIGYISDLATLDLTEPYHIKTGGESSLMFIGWNKYTQKTFSEDAWMDTSLYFQLHRYLIKAHSEPIVQVSNLFIVF